MAFHFYLYYRIFIFIADAVPCNHAPLTVRMLLFSTPHSCLTSPCLSPYSLQSRSRESVSYMVHRLKLGSIHYDQLFIADGCSLIHPMVGVKRESNRVLTYTNFIGTGVMNCTWPRCRARSVSLRHCLGGEGGRQRQAGQVRGAGRAG